MKLESQAWLANYLGASDIKAIEDAVERMEKKTSAEILPMIVSRSTPPALGARVLFWFTFAWVAVFWISIWNSFSDEVLSLVFDRMGSFPSAAEAVLLHALADAFVVVLALAASFLFSQFLLRFQALERWLLPKSVLAGAAVNRAEYEFSRSDLRSTEQGTGVLIFVSVFERQAVILADRAFAGKRADGKAGQTWNSESADLVDELLKQFILSIRAGSMKDGFVKTIEKLGEHLSEISPAREINKNEISDRVRIFE